MVSPFYWCGQQDSNLHAHAMEPKSTESTNSTMPAYSVILHRLPVAVPAYAGILSRQFFLVNRNGREVVSSYDIMYTNVRYIA